MENNNVAPASFGGLYSTNDIWVGVDEDQCLTDTLEEMESDIANHTHTGYAPTEHEHTGYADEDHTHTGYAPTSHSHAQSDISGLTANINAFTTALSGKADVSALTAKADLVDGKVPESQLPSYVDDVAEYDNLSAFPTAGESGKVYLAKDTNKAYRWGGTTYVEIAGGVALGETAATAHRGDHGKIAYDHSQNTAVHVTEAQKTAWDGKAEGEHNHDAAYMAKSLQFTSDIGGMEKTFYVEDNTNLITEFEALSMGFHTVYSQAGVEGNPNATESFRCFLHKPSSNIMWVLAFGTTGAIYSNYWNGGTWIGWDEVGRAKAVAYANNTGSTYKKVWIATTGSDDNPGTSASPMKTITGAIRKYSEQYKMLDISLADGTYNENLGALSPALTNLAIRSNSEDKDKVTINMTTTLEVNVPIMRMYNITLNVTEAGVRPISVTGGRLYAHNIRINVPETSGSSCVNVYNGCDAFMMNCVLNSGVSGSGAGMYGNQASLIKAINCTSERKVSVAFYAHNGTEIQYTDTMNATTKTKVSYYGKCTLLS